MMIASFLLALVVDICLSKFVTIKSLPGWKGALPSLWRSGFIDTSPSPNGKPMSTHYVFVECESNPLQAPTLLWQNGGPGASSLYGLFVELGPLRLNSQSYLGEYTKTGIPQLIYNEFSWTKFANVLVFDFPPPVGFSHCNHNVSGDGYSCGSWDDESTATTSHRFMVGLQKDLPQFFGSNSKLFIVGESYAGVYTPMLASKLQNDKTNKFNVVGVSVGDGCAGTEVLCGGNPGKYQKGLGPYYWLLFYHGHGQISNKLYDTIRAQCPKNDLISGKLSANCSALVTKALHTDLGRNFGYDLYDSCSSNIFRANSARKNNNLLHWERRRSPLRRRSVTPPTDAGEFNGYYCDADALDDWIDRADVRRALGVDVNSNFFNVDNGNDFNYTSTFPSVLPFYLQQIQSRTTRTMIYNADADPGINSFITQDIFFEFLDDEKIPIVDEWRPWSDSSNSSYTMGYLQAYQGNFSYVTVRGAGHMIMYYMSIPPYIMMKAFVENVVLPRN